MGGKTCPLAGGAALGFAYGFALPGAIAAFEPGPIPVLELFSGAELPGT